MNLKKICEAEGITMPPAKWSNDDSVVVVTLGALQRIAEQAVLASDAYAIAELKVLEAMKREMLAIAPNMRRTDLRTALDLVQNFAEALRPNAELHSLLSDIAARYESDPFGLPVGDDNNASDKAATDFLHWLGTRIVDFVPIKGAHSNRRQK